MSERLQVDLGAVPALVDRARERLASPGARILVEGTPGSGRRAVAHALEREGAVVVELPRRSSDALLSGLLQAGASVGWPLPAWADPTESARELGSRVAAAGRALVVLTERLWWTERSTADASPDDRVTTEHARAVFDAWTSDPNLGVVIVARPSPAAPSAFGRLRLPVAEVHRRELDRAGVWGGYASAARRLGNVMGSEARISPLVMRLAVGVVALDASCVHEVAQLASFGERYRDLARLLVDRAARVEALVPALRSLLLSRTAAPEPQVIEATAVPGDHVALITRCVSYGDTELRVSPTVASALREALESAASPDSFDEPTAHARWASARRALDGAVDPANLPARQVVQWVEKVHHLARAGAAGADEWARQHIVHRDLIWDRARTLSMSGAYPEAADLYRLCLDQQPQAVADRDDYSWHYLGYNLDRAGRPGAEHAFDRARSICPDNPWWNSRRVTHLIERGRVRDADRAWAEAISGIDPTGEVILERPELARQIHRWVATAWLDAGEVKRARAVLESVPSTARGDELWRALEHRLLDAEEAVRLGEVVRPNAMPMQDRWAPVALPEADENNVALGAWYPARVRGVTEAEVELVVGVPDADPDKRYVVEKVMTREAWLEAAHRGPREGMFVELGEYGDDVRVEVLPSNLSRPVAIDEASLRYLRS
jgi:hypothetical protein